VPPPAQHTVFQASVPAVNDHTERLPRLEQTRHEQVTSWRLKPVVEARQALRGGQCPGAVTRVAARGARSRGDTPRALMTCVELIPAAYATGAQRRQGPMTTAGHSPDRRVRVEGAWAARDPAPVSRHVPRRRERPPTAIQDISGHAPVRRGHRYRRLMAGGPHTD
jgi:transposase